MASGTCILVYDARALGSLSGICMNMDKLEFCPESGHEPWAEEIIKELCSYS
jgi:hypothetical protein